jgi:hypothetical protein
VRALKITATEPQGRFLAMQKQFRLFCGGYGCGKSETMANAALIDAVSAPNALIGLYAPTYDLIRLITAPRIQAKLEQHGIRYTYNKSEFSISTSSPGIGDFIMRSLDVPERIIGYETFSAHLDELDTLKTDHAEEAWQKCLGRNRQHNSRDPSAINRMSAYTTPEGFRFCHKQWVINSTDRHGLVKASTRTNPWLPEGYVDTIMATYPANLAAAYIDGDFVNLTSGTVYHSYDRIAHNSTEKIKPQEPLFFGMDFNVGKMAATIYVQRSNGWHAVAELKDVFDTPAMADLIKDRWKNQGHRIVVYPDASGSSRKTNEASRTDLAILQQAGFEVRVKSKNPAVRDRILAMNAAFDSGRLWVNARECPTVAGCLEQQAYGKNGEPDKTSGNDHQNDATGYPIAYEMPVSKPVVHTPIRFSY